MQISALPNASPSKSLVHPETLEFHYLPFIFGFSSELAGSKL
jgi:hypothetical protein